MKIPNWIAQRSFAVGWYRNIFDGLSFRTIVKPILLLVAGFFFLSITSSGIEAQPFEKLHKGLFLVATNNLNGSSFEKTVVLLIQYDDNSVMGLAINRPTDIKLYEAFPTLKPSLPDSILYLGGPVHPGAVFLLIDQKLSSDSIHIFGDIFLDGKIGLLSEFKKEDTPKINLRAYAGYAGWAPGQLEKEIQHGDWVIVEADKNTIFTQDTSQIWNNLMKTWSGLWI